MEENMNSVTELEQRKRIMICHVLLLSCDVISLETVTSPPPLGVSWNVCFRLLQGLAFELWLSSNCDYHILPRQIRSTSSVVLTENRSVWHWCFIPPPTLPGSNDTWANCFRSLSQFTHPSVRLSFYLSIQPSVCLFVHLCQPFIYRSVFLFVHPYVYLMPTFQTVSPSACLSVCLSTNGHLAYGFLSV